MGKYESLKKHLLDLDRNEWAASFSEIETVLGLPLPASARKYPAWWANEPHGSHVHARAWLDAGWKSSELNVTGETVRFERVRLDARRPTRHDPPKVSKSISKSSHEIQTTLKGKLSPARFEDLARRAFSDRLGKSLASRKVPEVNKIFDLVSEDHSVVGDAKYFTMVGGERIPPAKFSVIAEHVWLLEKTEARFAFLVFGNDRRVPDLWLAKYGNLVGDVKFFFLTDEGDVEQLET